MELQVGEWSLDKRHYMGAHPPKPLIPPPRCAHDRAHVLSTLINNASGSLGSRWPSSPSNLDRFNHLQLRDHPLRSHPVASRLLGTGPWLLSGGSVASGNAYRLEKLWVLDRGVLVSFVSAQLSPSASPLPSPRWILNHGFLISSKGHGRWGLVEGHADSSAGRRGRAGRHKAERIPG